MARLIFILVFLLCASGTYAQSTQTDKEHTLSQDTLSLNDKTSNDVVKAKKLSSQSQDNNLGEILSEKQSEIKILRDNIRVLNDSIISLNSFIKNEEKITSSELLNKQRIIDDLNHKNSDLINKLNAYSSISQIVYKQCLLYPLERKYDESFVKESVQCITVMGIKDNEKYKDVYNTYWDLLNNYSIYNEEIKSFLISQYESFNLKHWTLSEIIKEGSLKSMQRLSYYQYYKNKDVKPWKSIPYLDKVFDDYLSMMDDKSVLNQQNFNALIDRVSPKNKQN